MKEGLSHQVMCFSLRSLEGHDMLLAIDVGNTNTVFALFRQEQLIESWRCKTDKARSVDEYAVFLKQVFETVDLSWDNVDDVVISSVVPDTDFHLNGLCQKYLKREAFFITSKTADIIVELDNPEEIGADRLVNAAAVIAHYDMPAIVVDFGTATTFDVISEQGAYRGGSIAPGVRLSMQALTSRAAKLPNIKIEQPEKAVGKNTLQAMQSGMYWGYIGMIEKIIEKIEIESGGEHTVIATGGLAELYARNTATIDAVDDALTLKGLLEIYKKKKNA